MTKWYQQLLSKFHRSQLHAPLRKGIRRKHKFQPLVEPLEPRQLLTADVSITGYSDAAETGTNGEFTLYRTGDTSSSLTVDFSLTGTATDGTDYDPKDSSSNALTGSITIPEFESSAIVYIHPISDFDTEGTETITLTVDSGTGYTVGTPSSETIDLTDDTSSNNTVPSISPQTFDVDENSAASTVVGTVVASDPDSGQTLTYSITGGSGQSLFDINSSTGQLTVASGATIDYETSTIYSVDVKVVDDGTPVKDATAAISIDVNDLTELATVDEDPLYTVETLRPFNDYVQTHSQTGALLATVSPLVTVGGGAAPLVYASSTNSNPVITVDVLFSGDASSADHIEAELTFNGVSQGSVYYSTNGLPSGWTRFALQADATSLDSGYYDWDIDITEHYTSSTVTVSASGSYKVNNQTESYFGNGWSLAGLDQLVIETGGLLLVRGNGNSYWFEDNLDDTFARPDGELGFSTLIQNVDDSYTLTDKFGVVSDFDSAGLLTDVQIPGLEDATTFTYIDADSDTKVDEISKITDPLGRETTFAYTSGLVSSITDFASRVSTLAYDGSDRLTSITAPDPDGAGSQTATVASFAYNTDSFLTSMTVAGAATTFAYDAFNGINTVTDANSGVFDLDSQHFDSLVDTSVSGTLQNLAALILTSGVSATLTDELDRETTLDLGKYGHIMEVDGNLDVVGGYGGGFGAGFGGGFGGGGYDISGSLVYERNADGLVTKMTQDDPDGTGPETDFITQYTYDSKGNVTQITLPTSATRKWTYDSTHSQPLTYEDELGNDTVFTLDSSGNVLTVRQIAGLGNDTTNSETDDAVTTYTYTAAPVNSGDPPQGLVATETDAEGRVTAYEYNDHALVTKITYADGQTEETSTDYEYNSADNLTAVVDGLSRRTEFDYDTLGRLTEITEADPDGVGAQTSPVTTFEYDTSSRLTKVTDPLSRVTEYTYDSVGNQTKITLPDHDSDTNKTEIAYTFDAVNRVTQVLDGLGQKTTWTYGSTEEVDLPNPATPTTADTNYQTVSDTLGRTTSVTDPEGNETKYKFETFGKKVTTTFADPDGAGSQTKPTEITEFDNAGNVTKFTDALGNVTEYDYDQFQRLITVTQKDPDGAGPLTDLVTSYEYDKVGNLTSVTDPLNNETTYEYDRLNRLTKTTLEDPDGAGSQTAPVFTAAYDDASQLTSETDALSNVTSYEYDNLGRLTKITQPDPDGAGSQTSPITEFTYDAVGNVLTEKDPLLNTTTYVYDAHNNVTSITLPDPDGVGAQSSPVTSFTYDDNGQMLTSTDPLSNKTTLVYDGLGRVTSMTQPDPDGAGSQTAPVYASTYDLVGNVLTETDPLSNVTTYAFDNLYRLTKITFADPDGAGAQTSPTIDYKYDAAGSLTSVTDPLSNETTFEYDGFGRRTKMTLPDPDGVGSQTAPVYEYAYDKAGNLLTTTDPLSNDTDYEYDDLYRLTKVTLPDPDGAGGESAPELTYAYDALGQLTSSTDPLSRTTTIDYDNLGRRTKITEPDPDGVGTKVSEETEFEYDAVGNLLKTIDALSNETELEYDNLYRVTTLTDAETGDTTFTYDAADNVLTLTDPVNNETSWVYDDLNRVITETNELNKSRDFEYDAAGNLTEQTDRNGRVSQFEYDNLHRLIGEEWLNGSQTVIYDATFAYDAASRLISADDDYSDYALTYDNLGRRTQIDNTGTADQPDVILDSEYDALGNRTSLIATVDTNDDFENTYTYDNLSRLTRVEQTEQSGGNSVADKRVDFVYAADGQFASIDRYENLSGTQLVAATNYTYDGVGRLTDLTHSKGSTDLADYDWAFNDIGLISSMVSDDGTSTYTYDDTGQLLTATHTYATNETYTYDANGNRNMTGYTIGDNNQITSDGTWDYVYDDEGNRTKKTNISSGQVIEYEYDYHNRLTKITTKASAQGAVTHEVEYVYDVFGHRLAKKIDSDGDSDIDQSFQYIYDGLRPERGFAGDHIVLSYEDADGDGAGALALDARILHGPNVDQVLAHEDSSGDVLWALTDNLGSVRDIVNYASGTDTTTVDDHIIYGAFGNEISHSGTTEFLYGFTGRERDTESDLQFNRARHFDSALGQWVGEDSVGFSAGDSNLRRYISGDPVFASDPSGRFKYEIGPQGEIFAVSEEGDTLAQLIKEGLIDPGYPIPGTEALLPPETRIDVSDAYPDSVTDSIISQQNTPFDDVRNWNPNAPGVADIPPGKTIGSSGVDLSYPGGKWNEADEFEGGGNTWHGYPFGYGNCYGFAAAALGYDFSCDEARDVLLSQPPGSEGVKGSTVEEEELVDGPGEYPVVEDMRKWYPNGVKVVRSEGILDTLIGNNTVAESPSRNDIVLYKDREGLATHAGVVVGISREGIIYILQKYNESQPITLTPINTPIGEQFGTPEIYPGTEVNPGPGL